LMEAAVKQSTPPSRPSLKKRQFYCCYHYYSYPPNWNTPFTYYSLPQNRFLGEVVSQEVRNLSHRVVSTMTSVTPYRSSYPVWIYSPPKKDPFSKLNVVLVLSQHSTWGKNLHPAPASACLTTLRQSKRFHLHPPQYLADQPAIRSRFFLSPCDTSRKDWTYSIRGLSLANVILETEVGPKRHVIECSSLTQIRGKLRPGYNRTIRGDTEKS